jgi:sugar-specific transcriptional regulator TrmB
MATSNSNTQGRETLDLLMEVGLTETEATIYRYGLGEESVTVQEIGAATSIKRPTIYHALHTLSEKELVAERIRGGKSAFTMNAPAHLLGWVQRQKELLEKKESVVQRAVTQLTQLIPTGENAAGANVTHYDDAKSIQAIFDLALFARSQRCDLIIPSRSFLDRFDADGTRVANAEARGMNVHIVQRKQLESALFLFDDTVSLIAEDGTATVIVSAALRAALSLAIEK